MDLVVELPSRPSSSAGPPVSASTGVLCKYRTVAKLGGGSFGDILAAVNESDPEDWVALKIEAKYRANDMDRKRSEPSMVRFERLVCRELARGAAVEAVPTGADTGSRCVNSSYPCPVVRGCVCLHSEHDVLVMELLGPNLREYAAAYGHWPLPEDFVLIIGAALVGRLQQLHACGFVHRDLKPENLVLRLEERPDEGLVPCLLLVDYALAMRFAWPGGSSHIDRREDAEVAGTHRYMAIHAQKGVTQSRRSDLESLGHVLVYLALGQLPWQQLQDISEMLHRKEQTTVEELCHGLKPCFATFLKKCRNLDFDEQPDYEDLQRGLLEGVTGQINFEAARIRRGFKQYLREAYLRHEAACATRVSVPFTPVPKTQTAPVGALPSMLPIFVRHNLKTDATELIAYQPESVADFDDTRCFFFEGYREALPGTAHIVVGSCHFFSFLREDHLKMAHSEAGLDLGIVEQILVFSLGRRDWVARAAALRDYDASTGKSHKEWNLRSAFWSRVVPPWPAPAA